MKKTQQLIHDKRAIFYMDFSNLSNLQDINGIIDESIGFIRKQSIGSVLTLTNITGMHFNNEIKDVFNSFINGNKPYVRAGAVIGLSGLQKIIYNTLMRINWRDIKSFNNSEEAKKWLVSHK
jgi:hypothetical protein